MSIFAFQRFSPAIFASGLLLVGQSIHAQNKYDILARALQPYGALFYSKATSKAMQADVILREAPRRRSGDSQSAAPRLFADPG